MSFCLPSSASQRRVISPHDALCGEFGPGTSSAQTLSLTRTPPRCQNTAAVLTNSPSLPPFHSRAGKQSANKSLQSRSAHFLLKLIFRVEPVGLYRPNKNATIYLQVALCASSNHQHFFSHTESHLISIPLLLPSSSAGSQLAERSADDVPPSQPRPGTRAAG